MAGPDGQDKAFIKGGIPGGSGRYPGRGRPPVCKT